MDERTEELAGLYVMGVLTPAERQAFEIAMARNPGLVALVAGFRTVRDAMAGNLCRCTGYAGLVAAVVAAGREGTIPRCRPRQHRK